MDVKKQLLPSPFEARFGGVGRLFTREGLDCLRRAHVCVLGLGGVGSWAVEALARSGVGTLTLVDLDDVCVGNVNRQLHAVTEELGRPKVDAMKRRVQAINPECVVHAVQAFFLKSNARELLRPEFDYVLDAIDSPARKCLVIALCRERALPVITTGASAGRRDPTAVEVIDLAFSSHDRLLQEVRKKLRTRHGFPRGQNPFGVECVVSREPMVYPPSQTAIQRPAGSEPDLRLDCNTGFGTATFVTGTFGFVAAGRIIRHLAENDGGALGTARPTRPAR